VTEVDFKKCRKGLQRRCDLKIAIRDKGLLNIAGKWKSLLVTKTARNDQTVGRPVAVVRMAW